MCLETYVTDVSRIGHSTISCARSFLCRDGVVTTRSRHSSAERLAFSGADRAEARDSDRVERDRHVRSRRRKSDTFATDRGWAGEPMAARMAASRAKQGSISVMATRAPKKSRVTRMDLNTRPRVAPPTASRAEHGACWANCWVLVGARPAESVAWVGPATGYFLRPQVPRSHQRCHTSPPIAFRRGRSVSGRTGTPRVPSLTNTRLSADDRKRCEPTRRMGPWYWRPRESPPAQ
jgi:hypothetical protein